MQSFQNHTSIPGFERIAKDRRGLHEPKNGSEVLSTAAAEAAAPGPLADVVTELKGAAAAHRRDAGALNIIHRQSISVLAGSFSAVSKRNFARKHAFDSIFKFYKICILCTAAISNLFFLF